MGHLGKIIADQALKSFPKCNKSPNLVTLALSSGREYTLTKVKYHARLTSCFTGLDSTKLPADNFYKTKWMNSVQQKGHELNNDTSPYNVSEYSLPQKSVEHSYSSLQ